MNIKETITAIAAAFFALWSSRKLWMTFIGVSVLYGLYWHSAYWLVTGVPPEKITAFENMFQTTQIAIVGAILGYLGVQGWQNVFNRSAASATNAVVQNILSRSETKTDNAFKQELARGD